MWWEDEKNHRWVCYGCGMNRNKEYQKDQAKLKELKENYERQRHNN
jgi:hypothetical protein